jgi:isoquinoline 1-oxidoreductase subunit beta
MIFITNNLSRHGLLRTGTADGGGLLLSLCPPPGNSDAWTGARDLGPNTFICVGNDGQIVVTMPCNGVCSDVCIATPMLIADELEVEPARIRLEHAPHRDQPAGARASGGSNAPRESPTEVSRIPMRQLGAIARTMLVTAAALRWKVDPGSCQTRDGEVFHMPSGRYAGYGELATYAGCLPAPETVALKRTAETRFIDAQTKRIASPAKVNDAAAFRVATRPVGGKIATVAKAPTFGARVKSVDAAAVKGMRRISVP